MSYFPSREALIKKTSFILEFTSLKGWNLDQDQIIHISKNENYH